MIVSARPPISSAHSKGASNSVRPRTSVITAASSPKIATATTISRAASMTRRRPAAGPATGAGTSAWCIGSAPVRGIDVAEIQAAEGLAKHIGPGCGQQHRAGELDRGDDVAGFRCLGLENPDLLHGRCVSEAGAHAVDDRLDR